MTQVEMLTRITEIIRNLPESNEMVWSALPDIPFGLPLGRPACYFKNYGEVIFRIPKQDTPITPGMVNAIAAGNSSAFNGDGKLLEDEEDFTAVGITEFLEYLGFTKRKKIAECILREYELELALNDYEPGEVKGNSWILFAGEGKQRILELLLGYTYPTPCGVSVDRVDVAWQAYTDECDKAGTGIDWNAKIPAEYKMFIKSPVGKSGVQWSEPETIEEFLKRIK